MDCPNDRYVNDEAICQAVTQMLARIGIKVLLNAHAEGEILREGRASPGSYDSSFYLLGWTPGSFDSWNVHRQHHRLPRRGRQGRRLFNYGGLLQSPGSRSSTRRSWSRPTPPSATSMIAEAFRINHEEAGVIPLHQQALAWGVSKKVKIVQRADNQILFYWVKMK